jgi:hypothetical protein
MVERMTRGSRLLDGLDCDDLSEKGHSTAPITRTVIFKLPGLLEIIF